MIGHRLLAFGRVRSQAGSSQSAGVICRTIRACPHFASTLLVENCVVHIKRSRDLLAETGEAAHQVAVTPSMPG